MATPRVRFATLRMNGVFVDAPGSIKRGRDYTVLEQHPNHTMQSSARPLRSRGRE